MKIIQIAHELPPKVGGISDYVMQLAEKLYYNHEIKTYFMDFQHILTDDSFLSSGIFQVKDLLSAERKEESYIKHDEVDVILVHYSFSSNFSKRASKLLELIKLVKTKFSLKIIIMFHELYPLGMNAKFRRIVRQFYSSFSDMEALPARGFAKVADSIISNSSRYKDDLNRWSNCQVKIISNFSTIAEPNIISEINDRERKLIVFGKKNGRFNLYSKNEQAIRRICQALSIEQLIDIGKADRRITDILGNLNKLDNIEVIQKGILPSQEVSQLMSSSYAGLLDYSKFPGDLGKSSVFAGYCSHGLLPIICRYNPSEHDGIFQGVHYVVANKQLKSYSPSELQLIAKNANDWYGNHTSVKGASVFASSIFDVMM